MATTPEEMRLRDAAIGSQAEIVEANYQREKVELANAELRNKIVEANHQQKKVELTNAELRNEIQVLNDRIRIERVAQEASQQATEKLLRVIAMRDAEIIAIHQSHTWKIGFFVMAPLRWIKRSKR